MRLILYPVGKTYARHCLTAASFLRLITLLLLCFFGYSRVSAQFQLGENPGYYGTQFTDQQLYDLMYAGGARSARATVSMQYYLQYGMATYEARLQYPYSTKGMRNNTFFLDCTGGPTYAGQSDSTASNGAQSWLPNGLWLPAFNSDGSINTNNLWAKYCYDVVQSIGPYFTYFEVWNEPDLTGSVNSYEDSTQSSSSWEIVEPASGDLPNMNAPIEDYVQLCKIANQVIKTYQPNAKIATGGLGYPWFYMWFLKKGGGQWIDELSIHYYPYFAWTTCVWTGSACGTAGFHRNSDYAVSAMTTQINSFRAIETQLGAAHKPMIMTESNIPRWNYVSAANLETFPNNKAWGSDQTQKDYTIKAFSKMMVDGLDMFYLFQTGETGDSGLNDGTAGSEIDAMGMYKNLTKASPGNTQLTNQGIAIQTMQKLMNNYKVDATQPSFPSGVDGVRFDSSGNKIYVVWAITTLDMSETASGTFTLPSGTNFKEYKYDGSSPGTVSASVAVTGEPIFLVQTSGTVSSVNCNAGGNQSITLPTNTATLSAAASTVTGSTIASYAWNQVSGPSTATLTNAQTVAATANNLVAGTYSFAVTVKDAAGDSCSSTMQITVTAPLSPPTVSAGTNQTITLPTNSASLVGVATDLSGTITSYTWTQVSGPSTATISSAGTIATAVKGLVAGTYVFQLKVSDNNNLSASGTVTITVNAAAHQPPVANAGSNQTITLPLDSASLSGSASTDPDGTITGYAWKQISGPASSTIESGSSVNTTVTGLEQGAYSFQLTVTDNAGATSSDTISVTVNAAVHQPPVANAGSSQTITLPTSSTNLDGSKSSDPDGTIVSYGWTELSGPSNATITGATSVKPTVSGLAAGTYTFQLTVTDNASASANATVKITVVAPVIQPPVANAGANQTITLPLDSVILNGDASEDPGGTITSYSWSELNGPSSALIEKSGSATTNVNSLEEGTYTFQLTVTNNDGASASDTITVTVNAAVSQPPVANAGPSQTITLPTNTVTLDGSKSYAPGGTITSYSWTQLSGPSAATISGAATASPSISGLAAGRYTFQLTVTDNSGASTSASVRITVIAAATTTPVADAGPDQTITLPLDSVTLSGSGSLDAGGTITGYSWKEISGPTTATIESASAVSTEVTAMTKGSYSFQLMVTDNNGKTDADTVNVLVNPALNIPPVANAGPSQTITLPTNTVTLDGSKSYDPDGTIASYRWVEVSGPSAATMGTANSATSSVSDMIAGRYTFQLTVTDNDGATSSAMVRITVIAAVNQPPVANAGNDQTIMLPLDSATLDGSASIDPDGTIAAYNWSEVSGPSAANIRTPNGSTTVVMGLAAGTYVFKLTVTDNNGASASDTMSITVDAPAHIPPVANAGTSQTITLPLDSLTLDGTKSYDEDGTITAYQWTQVSGPATATIAGGTTATPSVKGLVAGRYTFQLTITDNDGATSSATVRITVAAAPADAPVANAGPDQTITLPTSSVSLDGSKSYDVNGSIVSYQWTEISGNGNPVTITGASTATPTVTELTPGKFVFQLIVTNNVGATGVDEVAVTVNEPVVEPPVADAGTDISLELPTNSTPLNGTKSYDPNGKIVSYSWSEVSGPSFAVIGNYNTATPTVSALEAGSYIFRLTVTNNAGASASDDVTVDVGSVLLPPIANAGIDTTIAIPASSSVLNGSASKAQTGTLKSFLWTQLSGPSTASIASADSSVTMVEGLAGGTYTFQLSVTDSYGQSDTASVKVTVMSELRTAQATSLVLYPNPAQNSVNLQITGASTGTMRVNIYNLLGQLVLSEQTEKSSSYFSAPVDIGSLPAGAYTMQVEIGSSSQMTTKFIKQ